MESVIIENKGGEDILVTVLSTSGGKTKLGITAPRDLYVHRQEVFDKIQAKEKSQAEQTP